MGHPVFVTEIRPETNQVVIGEAEDVFSRELVCEQINFMGWGDLKEPARVLAKIRYSHAGAPATIYREGEDRIRCIFDEPVRAVTPGQAAVFYEDGRIVCGGEIISCKTNINMIH
jgi:tRNA-specific 2-thiouridylase